GAVGVAAANVEQVSPEAIQVVGRLVSIPAEYAVAVLVGALLRYQAHVRQGVGEVIEAAIEHRQLLAEVAVLWQPVAVFVESRFWCQRAAAGRSERLIK